MFCCAGVFAQDAEDDACTSIMVGRLASKDGAVITSHTCDGKYRTWSYMEPAADHEPGTLHALQKGTMKTAFRGDTTGVVTLGYIPEAPHTFAYLNTCYPSLNEKNVGIGETTFNGPDTLRSDNGLFMVEELQRVALQRCSSAREAVELMGALAEQYGYIDGGECLTVADEREVWQFEILGPGKGKLGAVWVAKRVPDDHVAVSANVPRIGLIERGDSANFLCSENVESVALDHGLWDGESEFKFWQVYNCTYGRGQNHREREWWILSTLAPSLELAYDAVELPFSVKPEIEVDARVVMNLLRSTYEGTQYSMVRNITLNGTVSPIANPWMTTEMRNTLMEIAPGKVEFARNVSVAWCCYSTVIDINAARPEPMRAICWLAYDNPGQSPHIPIFSGSTKLPDGFDRCGQNVFDPDIPLWRYRKANKLATLAWQRTKDEFIKIVLEEEQKAFDGLSNLKPCPCKLNAYTETIYNETSTRWKQMEDRYWVMFGMGF